MATAIYQDVSTGRHHWAESTSPATKTMLTSGRWVLFDDTPTTPPPTTDPLGAEMAERVPPGNPFGDALRAASVAAVEDAATVAPTGAWDFTGATVTGVGGGGAVADATTTTKGVVELATTTETTTGTDTTRAVTPAGLAAALAPAVTSTTVDQIVTLTQAAYDALGTKDPATLYVVNG